MKTNTSTQQGFTLIEVMMVVGMLGIISAFAFPSYMEQVRKAKRADAKVELLRIAQLQESYFVQNLSYANRLTAGAGGLGMAPDGETVHTDQVEYDMSIVATPAGCTGLAGANACTQYTITAGANANGSQGNDKCGSFTVTNTGAKNVVGAHTGYDGPKCWK